MQIARELIGDLGCRKLPEAESWSGKKVRR